MISAISKFGSDALPGLANTNQDAAKVSVRLNASSAKVAKLGPVKVTGPNTVKAGAKSTCKVRITNVGNATATGVVLKTSGSGILSKKTVGTIAAGKTRIVSVSVTPKRTGEIKVVFAVTSSNAGSKTVRF